MNASTHPNQVRAACERCRQLKLRCLRQTPPEPSCTRCTRLNLHCQPGAQRKVGRPPRRDVVKSRQRRQPHMLDGDAGRGTSDTEFQFLDDLAKGTLDIDWPIPGMPSFEFDSLDKMALSSGMPSIIQELDPPHRDQALIVTSRSQTRPPYQAHFEMLSKINAELHGLCNSVFQHTVGMNFETFACFAAEDFEGMKAFKIIMQTAQDYLAAIKAVHKMIGTKTTPAESPSPASSTLSPETLVEKACSATSTASFNDTLPRLEPPPSGPQATHTLDSPTAFLVISCFVQLLRPLEFIMTLMHAHVADTTPETPAPAEGMTFADVTIADFSTQALLAIELTQHTLNQIQLVLGLPSPWSHKSMWTGLLSAQRYRDMLNEELGMIEGLWTTRPAKLMELMSVTKKVLLEHSMGRDW
ncbi:hypothetical protein AK830_g5534 [Neonectria ditissima]|uniref:Zn(2)-C6 fungal-type domain-containing protein n=1 Tax=Neonectria ditissima TaxID=78410 RepID=A0A0P7BE39_9HYPO|nr:hypothetical protein AK830_g5534 [Neonectria ditissima]